jgi:hypothetical protein
VLARLFLDRGQVTDTLVDAVVAQWLTTLKRTGALPHPHTPTGTGS